jgi:hypothetical protein
LIGESRANQQSAGNCTDNRQIFPFPLIYSLDLLTYTTPSPYVFLRESMHTAASFHHLYNCGLGKLGKRRRKDCPFKECTEKNYISFIYLLHIWLLHNKNGVGVTQQIC